MDFDSALFENFQKDETPVLRLYQWSSPSITIGRFQDEKKFLDIEKCKQDGVPVLRRITGGGALFHDNEITFSFVLRDESGLPVKDAYGTLNRFLFLFYEKLGLKASFAGKTSNPYSVTGLCQAGVEKYDILIASRKIGGSAQRRKRNIVFQHGVIPLDVDFEKQKKYMKMPEDVSLTSLKDEGIRLPVEELKKILKNSFEVCFGVEKWI